MVSLLDPRWLPGSLLSLIRALSMKRFLRKSQLVINALTGNPYPELAERPECVSAAGSGFPGS
jgi:hypothetical protein